MPGGNHHPVCHWQAWQAGQQGCLRRSHSRLLVLPSCPLHLCMPEQVCCCCASSRTHLPEGQEHHCLHQHKLKQRIEGLQQFRGSIPEQNEPVERQRVAHIVQDGDVEVPVQSTTHPIQPKPQLWSLQGLTCPCRAPAALLPAVHVDSAIFELLLLLQAVVPHVHSTCAAQQLSQFGFLAVPAAVLFSPIAGAHVTISVCSTCIHEQHKCCHDWL